MRVEGTDREIVIMRMALTELGHTYRRLGHTPPPELPAMKLALKAPNTEHNRSPAGVVAEGSDDSHESVLLTYVEVAAMTKLSPTTLRRHVAAGRLRAVGRGRGTRFTPDDVATFVANLPDRGAA